MFSAFFLCLPQLLDNSALLPGNQQKRVYSHVLQLVFLEVDQGNKLCN